MTDRFFDGPDGVSVDVLSTGSEGPLAEALALRTRGAGVVAVLSADEAISIAWRLDHVAGMLARGVPEESGVDYRPYWQVDPCPSWCATGHQDADAPGTRFHDTQWPPELALEEWGHLDGAPRELEVTGWMPVTAAWPLVRMWVDGVSWDLHIDEAQALAESARARALAVQPGVRADMDPEPEPDVPDPWFPEPESMRVCAMSGKAAGVMIDMPGMDDWKVRCPACGMTWTGGSTTLKRHIEAFSVAR